MNKLQKRILVNFVVVLVVTATAVVGMVELKNLVNRSEAMRAMESLGRVVSDYKQKNGSIPPESHVDGIIKSLEGQLRLGNLCYRAQWIAFDSPPDTILAYARKKYRSLFSRSGAIVLRFDGRIEWMDNASFDKLIAGQQTPMELEMTPK
ncbi:MAG: hypothetical protein IMZ61_11200 [Planctomycetes bacterium]|nr:hypothetical protein [Planctomycetota bacterium]